MMNATVCIRLSWCCWSEMKCWIIITPQKKESSLFFSHAVLNFVGSLNSIKRNVEKLPWDIVRSSCFAVGWYWSRGFHPICIGDRHHRDDKWRYDEGACRWNCTDEPWDNQQGDQGEWGRLRIRIATSVDAVNDKVLSGTQAMMTSKSACPRVEECLKGGASVIGRFALTGEKWVVGNGGGVDLRTIICVDIDVRQIRGVGWIKGSVVV